MWNGQTSNDGGSIDFSYAINGSGSALGSLSSTNSNADFLALLAEYDFRVWEILDGFYEQAWPTMKGIGMSHRYASLPPALMLHAVRFGIPTGVKAACASGGVDVSWGHPSAWAAGTRLRWYNVYRRAAGEPMPEEPIAQVPATETAFHDSPPPGEWAYHLTAQDRTAAFRNQSLPSASVVVDTRAGCSR